MSLAAASRGFQLAGLTALLGWLPGLAQAASEVWAPPAAISSEALFSTPLFDLKDQATDLAGYRGKPLIVNFWARWCGPCKVEMPEFIALEKRQTGVRVIGLNMESNAGAVREFAYAYDINYPVFLTRESGLALMQKLGNAKKALPFTVVFNAHGKLVGSHVGVLTRENLDSALALANSVGVASAP